MKTFDISDLELDITNSRVYQREQFVIYIMALINNEFENGYREDRDKRDFYSILTEISRSITHLSDTSEESAIERMINGQESAKLLSRFDEYLDIAIRVMKWDSIVIECPNLITWNMQTNSFTPISIDSMGLLLGVKWIFENGIGLQYTT